MAEPEEHTREQQTGEQQTGIGEPTSGLRRTALSVLALGMAVFHLAAASPLWIAPHYQLRAIHLLFAALVLILLFPSRARRVGPLLDAAVAGLALIGLGYAAIFHQSIQVRPVWTLEASPLELFVALATVAVSLEITRRALGWTITILCLVFIVYAFIGPQLRFVSWLRPLAHGGVGINEFVDQMYFSYEGVFGTALAVSAQYIFLFVMFGAVLQVAGGGDFFMAATRALTGARRGGPAKMAVIASGLTGMMSGSTVANVATTGSLTIPMMKKLGYPPRYAGAIEAVASTGGQLTPPIMGAAAFLMAAILGIDYVDVIAAASIPAALFYATLIIAVHLLALKYDLPPMAPAERGATWRIMRSGWTFLIPVALLVVLMVRGYTPSFSAFFGVVAALVVPYLRRSTFVSAKEMLQGIRLGVEGAAVVAAACASAGVIVGIVQISGLGFRFSALVTGFAGGSLDAALVLAMVAAFVFGMGMPTTAAYIIQATLVAPALTQLGADPMAAHLFVFYYAVLGQITPPLAVAAYAAAPIAGVSASKVGWTACLIGAPLYIIPFMFVSNTTLLDPTASLDFILAALRSLAAVGALSLAVIGWLGAGPLGWPSRVACFAAAALMVHPDMATTIAGVAILAAALLLRRIGAGAGGAARATEEAPQ